MTKKDEENDLEPTLEDELDTLEDDLNPSDEDDDPTSIDDEDVVVEDEPEKNIVDMFLDGDIDGVKQHVHDATVLAVSGVINADAEVVPDEPEEKDEE